MHDKWSDEEPSGDEKPEHSRLPKKRSHPEKKKKHAEDVSSDEEDASKHKKHSKKHKKEKRVDDSSSSEEEEDKQSKSHRRKTEDELLRENLQKCITAYTHIGNAVKPYVDPDTEPESIVTMLYELVDSKDVPDTSKDMLAGKIFGSINKIANVWIKTKLLKNDYFRGFFNDFATSKVMTFYDTMTKAKELQFAMTGETLKKWLKNHERQNKLTRGLKQLFKTLKMASEDMKSRKLVIRKRK